MTDHVSFRKQCEPHGALPNERWRYWKHIKILSTLVRASKPPRKITSTGHRWLTLDDAQQLSLFVRLSMTEYCYMPVPSSTKGGLCIRLITGAILRGRSQNPWPRESSQAGVPSSAFWHHILMVLAAGARSLCRH